MKTDLLKKSEELRSAFTVAQSQSGVLGVKAKAALENAAESLDTTIARLWELNDFLDLTAIEVDDPEFRANLAYWDALPGGILSGNEALAELYKEHSATLLQLYQGAVDITRVVKFSDAELEAATVIGQDFKQFQKSFHAMKYGLANYKPGSDQVIWNFPFVAQKPTAMLVERLVRLGFVSGASYKQKLLDGSWIPIAPMELRHKQLTGEQAIKNYDFEVTLEGFDAKNALFLTGHWFEAYAYSVFRDQLERIDADFEIYTQVSYEANLEGSGKSKSDFDVLINTGDLLVLVECKSGKLDDVEGKSIISKTNFLKQVFSNTRVKDFMFVLVYSPRDPATDTVIKSLGDHNIQCLQPHELRGFIVDNIR